MRQGKRFEYKRKQREMEADEAVGVNEAVGRQ
jgi:hypothetical protein